MTVLDSLHRSPVFVHFHQALHYPPKALRAGTHSKGFRVSQCYDLQMVFPSFFFFFFFSMGHTSRSASF